MIFNPLDSFYKNPIGALNEKHKITFRVVGNFEFVNIVLSKDGQDTNKKVAFKEKSDFFVCDKITDNNKIFELRLTIKRGLYFYYFETNVGNVYKGDGYLGEITDKVNLFQLSVYDKDFQIPTFLNGGIIYQIFPDRFNLHNKNKVVKGDRVIHKNLKDVPVFLPDSHGEVLNNDFFGGDLKGITDKLDYIKSLGVSAIYLNPITKAYSNHRYDIGDYFEIDDMLGTEQDLIELIEKSKELGIGIILDGVYNHTGSDSRYFNKKNNYSELGAYQSKESKYYSWYNFIKYNTDYECWWGIKTLPQVNKESGFVDFITGKNGVIDHYMSLGIMGLRLDVVDELPSHFVKKIREAVKRNNSEAILIGEVWEDASNKISYGIRREYFLGEELDSVMNYPLKNAIISYVKSGNVSEISNVIKSQLDHYPHILLNSLMNFLSTHDTFRLISALSDREVTGMSKLEMSEIKLSGEDRRILFNKVKIATFINYTLYGAVSIYYGDEIGMEGYLDPLNRKFFEWENVGNDINKWHILLGKLRSENIAIREGKTQLLYAKDGAIVYKRFTENQELLICVNLGERELILEYDSSLYEMISQNIYEKKCVITKNNFGIFKKHA